VKILSQNLVEIKHGRRAVNTNAHTLAKHDIMHMLDELWVEECPSYFQSIVLKEKVSSS
jgi:hypothetical protein